MKLKLLSSFSQKNTTITKNHQLSVVIPTFNRCSQLCNCLDCLFKQNYPRDNYEIIVIDDNSQDQTSENLIKYSSKYYNLKVIRNNKTKGPYRSRNLGAKSSKGEILLFTDDDCICPSNWLSKINKAFQNPKVRCVQGTQKYRGKIPCLEPEGKIYIKMLQDKKSLDAKNFAIRRRLFQKFCFNENLVNVGDKELSQRLALSHINIKYDPNIWVIHIANHSYKDQIIRAKNWGKSLAYINKIHGWKASNPKYRYPFPILCFIYFMGFPYILLRQRSLKGSIAYFSMLIVQGLYFKRSVKKLMVKHTLI